MMQERVLKLLSRLGEVEASLGDPKILSDQKEFKKLSQEHAYISDLKELWEKREICLKNQADNRELLKQEQDAEFSALLEEEVLQTDNELKELDSKIDQLLVPPDPNDHCNTIIELRAGTGGDEAALFVGDCVRMYRLYSDAMGWKCEALSYNEAEVGGYKEYIMVMTGKNVHRCMQYEGGTHRVQRVPATESQGRVHTSAITVATLLEPEQVDIHINEKDLRIDTYRSSGAGGQHVNTTDSAVRITHLPSGIVSYCQQEKSQHKNKDKAMRLLKAKILEHEEQKLKAERSSAREAQVGSGDRSERIRTYNFPQNRLTDHRINLTLYSLDKIINGELAEVSNALIAHYHQKKIEQGS
ncbi:MAG: Peptide chain release factor 1 [Chlamydiae bacterium]|nr:Peptide chain release factor 1 [Chlamydiota bacterium]